MTLLFFVSDAMSLPRSTHKYKVVVMKLKLDSATLFKKNQSLQVATTPPQLTLLPNLAACVGKSAFEASRLSD